MKIKRLIIVISALVILGLIILCSAKKIEEKESERAIEITPEEEISEEQERKTMITLYFKDKETGELSTEFRSIDAKILANNPYEKLINLLIEGPKTENLQKILPEDTKVNNIELIGNTIYLDLSKEFIENHEEGIKNESNTVYSIVNTLTELNEVTFVKILIDGQENLSFKDGCMNFNDNFERND